MSRALEDVVVVDLTTEYWSGLAGAFLGDFGADVIRVENLSEPRRDPDRDGLHPREPINAEAELIHRNKRGVALDLTDETDRERFTRLVAAADVFLTDLPFATLDARGWDPSSLQQVRADLVYARGSGFGPHGPDRDLPALDELAAARTGVMPTLPEPGEPPVYTAVGQMYTAAMLALGVVLALRHRNRTGEGQVVDASLFSGNLYAASLTLDAYLAMRDDRLSEPVARLDAGNPMSGASLAYPTSDGRWITLTMPDSDRWWPAFSEAVGLDVDDPRFDTHDKRCGPSRLEMMHLLDGIFAQQPGTHWRKVFDEKRLSADVMEKYDYPAGDEQAYLNRFVLELDHPSYGRFRSLGFPIHMSETPARLRRLAPCAGQHTDEVFDEISVRNMTPRDGGPEGDAATAALDGIRVLDATVWFQGPVCAQHLADFGAEVIHVERPETGDQARGVRSINAVPVADWNQYFQVVNRNKKSLAVDLKSDGGRELMHRLVAESDVFLWNQGMGGLKKLGLDYETLSSINPRLVYATNSGYGHLGSDRPAFDMTVQALTGIMTRLSEPGQPPVYLGLGAGDAYGGLLSALGIVLALHRREQTGRGQHIDASLYGAQLFLAAPSLQPFLATGNPFYTDQHARHDARNPLWNRYRAQDRWMFLCLENTDENWSRLCVALETDDLRGDDRFATAEQRARENGALVDALDSAFAARDAQAWTERLRAAGIPAAPIDSFRDVAEDEQAWANDYFTRGNCTEVNREVEFRGLPLTLSRTPGRVESLGPELGQDTELILFDTLGYTWDEIGALKASGAIP
ncbi:MAG: CoA transferase [Acidimicrobiia bacterium]|nr:CoA transferase [Acidimicrobiia bacterium]